MSGADASETAFERLYDDEFATVALAAGEVCRDEALAERIAQEAFAVASASWPRVAGMADPGEWVRRIAVELATEHRDRGRRPKPHVWSRPTMVFVTSPALGPGALLPTIEAMAGRGHATSMVDLSDVADLPRPRWRSAAGRIAAAVYATHGPVVLVGHGQAGPLLVPVAELRRVSGLILVDTALPPLSGEVPTLPHGLVASLADRIVDGCLPPWEVWWPQCALEFLVEDAAQRAALRAELPAVPASYGDEEVPIGPRWRSVPAGYLRLSLVRESEATFAGMRGLAVERLEADHLATATAPDAVADKLAALMAALEPAMI